MKQSQQEGEGFHGTLSALAEVEGDRGRDRGLEVLHHYPVEGEDATQAQRRGIGSDCDLRVLFGPQAYVLVGLRGDR